MSAGRVNAARWAFIPAVVLIAAFTGPVSAQDSVRSDPLSAMKHARQLLEAGAFRDARSIYATALGQLPERVETQELRAAAHFGRGFAEHQRLMAGDTLDSRVVVDSVVGDYQRALSLNPARLEVAASNNAALVLSAVGRHEAAAAYFRRAASRSHPDHVTFLWNAGKEYEALGKSDSAAWFYRRALESDSTYTDALRSLLDLYARAAPAEATLEGAVRWRGDSARAKLVTNALLTLLYRAEPSVSDAHAVTALVSLATALPVARFGPSSFGITLREPLRRITERRPALQTGIAALIDAYTPRSGSRTYRESADAAWWHAEEYRDDGRRAAWSSVLRWIGDTYNQQGERAVAQSYYEAAIGGARRQLTDQWVDRRALLPLALIYTQQADRASDARLQNDVNRFTELLFDAKAQAYKTGDLERIRDYHTTLGALYAAREQWTGPGAQNALFQLEHMRKTSQALARRTNRPVDDPPELLEKLAIGYQRTGKTQQANTVKRDVEERYRRQGRPEEGAAAVQRIERASRSPQTSVVPDARTPANAPPAGEKAPSRPSPAAVLPARSDSGARVTSAAGAAGARAASSIRGKIVDARTGRPVHGARVTAVRPANDRPVASVTDSLGAFTMQVSGRDSTVHIRIEAKGYRLLEQHVGRATGVVIRLTRSP